jgi:hypothetical protein
MRIPMCKAMFGVLCLLTVQVFAARPASAQALLNCTSDMAITYLQGLKATPQNEVIELDSVFVNCVAVPVTAPVPSKFHWQGLASNISCTNTKGDSVSNATGVLTWDDGSTSNAQFLSLTNVGLDGITPATATFLITSGHGAGEKFVTVSVYVPAPNQLSCSDSNPIRILTGQGTNTEESLL